MTPTSYESHVTIEPVFGERFAGFESLCRAYQFRPAELLLQKARTETPLRSNKDSFCTGHSSEYSELFVRTMQLTEELKKYGYQVWRYKIEGILLDVRTSPLVNIQEPI